VMYNGKIVEHGDTQRILTEPRHIYTQELLRSVPIIQEYSHVG
jgi:oligopeptide/dipeptide ABC transporter ATP-binding protein